MAFAYPSELPLAAVKTIIEIIRANEVATRTAVFANSIWEVQGYGQHILIGDPEVVMAMADKGGKDDTTAAQADKGEKDETPTAQADKGGKDDTPAAQADKGGKDESTLKIELGHDVGVATQADKGCDPDPVVACLEKLVADHDSGALATQGVDSLPWDTIVKWAMEQLAALLGNK